MATITCRRARRSTDLITYVTSLLAIAFIVGPFAATTATAWGGETRNVLLVTMDGLRWQELFGGADQRLIDKEAGGVSEPDDLRRRFWRSAAKQRREALMPFFWSVIARQGQVLGDPERNSSVMVTNGRCFSYPGYNELLCGFGDAAINSNDKVPNRNTTVLEWLQKTPEYQDRVAAFASWDVFPYILNVERSGIYVNAGWQALDVWGDAAATHTLNSLADQLPKFWAGVRYDAFTYLGAMDYLRAKLPRVLYVALGETDDWAHAGRYDLYLDAARRNDQYIQDLWEAAQTIPQYRGRTTLIVATDHGRGDGREGWKSHSADVSGSDRMWLAVLGPDTPSQGVVADARATQSQIAATVAAALGRDFPQSDDRIAPPLDVFQSAD